MRKLADRDLVGALVLFLVGGVSLSGLGTGMQNWLFPQVLTYLIFFVGAVLMLRVMLGAAVKHVPNIMRASREDHGVIVDVLVFCAIVLAYILLLDGLGFWLSSFLMLSLASIYLTPKKTRRNIVLAVVVSLVACALAYVVFLHVFYVPLPEATWWAGFGN